MQHPCVFSYLRVVAQAEGEKSHMFTELGPLRAGDISLHQMERNETSVTGPGARPGQTDMPIVHVRGTKLEREVVRKFNEI